MKNVFYSIKTKGISSNDVCAEINSEPSNQHRITCDPKEGGGIWIEIKDDTKEMGLKHKLERELEIKLGNPQNEE